MTELSGNKRRVHTRHEAHGSVSVSAVVLPAGANPQIGRCEPEAFAEPPGLSGKFKETEPIGIKSHNGAGSSTNRRQTVFLACDRFSKQDYTDGDQQPHGK